MDETQPELRIIAGPNGSGKTTFVKDFLPLYAQVRNFVNADLIAAGLSPFAPETVALTAGRLVLTEIRRLADQRQDFAFETTLSGKTYESLVRTTREQGYRIYLYFLWLPQVELNVKRVALRVRTGGHNVPEEDIRRRYRRSIVNFLEVYAPLTDSWVIFDNSGELPAKIAFARGNLATIVDKVKYEQFIESGHEP